MKLIKLSPLVWRGLLVAFAVLCVGLMALLWNTGKSETADAFASGRRLLIRLDDGTIQGKFINSKAPPAATLAETTPPPAPAPPATPAVEPPKAEAAPTPPAAPAVDASAVAQAPIPAPVPEASAVAQVPVTAPVAETPPAAPAAQASGVAEALPPVAVPEAPGEVVPTASNVPSLPPATPDLANMAARASGAALPSMNPALVEKTATGLLPVIGRDGTKPWRYYARPFQRSGEQPVIAIIITGLGENKGVSDAALKLPEEITLSFSPYAREIASWGTAAGATGHEVLLDLPLEPANYPAADPGPHGLMANRGVSESETQLEWNMMRLSTTIGFLTPQNEGFSANGEVFKMLMQSLANRGLMLVIGHEPAKTETKEFLESTSTANVVADVLIDEDLSPMAIQTRLTALEELAKKRGYAVAIAQGYPVTIEQLRLWSETLKAKGFTLAPVSAVVRLRFS